MGRRVALLIASYLYEDGDLKGLTAPPHDADALADVLSDPRIAGFEVAMSVNEPHHQVGERIGAFYRDSGRDDLTLLYFTGHGLKDDEGRLYLATTNTRRDNLLFTALLAEHIDKALESSPSRQKVLILDCCYSGAYPAGRAVKAGGQVHTLERFQGRGRAVLTASDTMQYSFEGDQRHGEAAQSVFTRHLVAGLRDGSADLDGDGDITIDELYSYVHDRVVEEMPQQRPKKQDSVLGNIVIARNVNWDLPAYLRSSIHSPIATDRLGAPPALSRELPSPLRITRAVLSPPSPSSEVQRVAFSAVQRPASTRKSANQLVLRQAQQEYLGTVKYAWRAIDLAALSANLDAASQQRVMRLPLKSVFVSLVADDIDLADADKVHADGVSLDEAAAKHRLLIVLGLPGSGKTVVCQWLALQAAERSQSIGPGQPLGRLPVLVRAADYLADCVARLDGGLRVRTVIEYVQDELVSLAFDNCQHAPEMVQLAIEEGRLYLLIDGLDELSRHRDELLGAIVDEIEAMPSGNRFVITSRRHAYDRAQLPLSGAAHYLIRPMSADQIRSFATRFCEVAVPDEDPAPLLDAILDHESPARYLAETPLVLVSLCSNWQTNRQLPANRGALYRTLLLDMAQRWRNWIIDLHTSAAGAGAVAVDSDFNNNNVLMVLAHVAFAIHTRYPSGRIPEADLIELLGEVAFGQRRLYEPETGPVLRDLVRAIQVKPGILSMLEPGQYGFVHQSFREYLLGIRVIAERDGMGPRPPALVRSFAARLDDPTWREPLLLALDECEPDTREAMVATVLDGASGPIEPWAELFLAAAERSGSTDPAALELALRLAMPAYATAVEDQSLSTGLAGQIAGLRRRVGAAGFDRVALPLLDHSNGPALGHLYLRRGWLSDAVIRAAAAAFRYDDGRLDWPLHRILRTAGAPEDSQRRAVPDPGPAPPTSDALFAGIPRPIDLYRAGGDAWHVAYQAAGEATVEPIPDGVLPVRDALSRSPATWQAAIGDPAAASALAAMAGGFDDRDAEHTDYDYLDLARIVTMRSGLQRWTIEHLASEVVPRFGVSDVVFAIATHLDSLGAWSSQPSAALRHPPELRPEWLTAPTTTAVQAALLRWADRGAAPKLLPAALDEVSYGDADEVDHAIASLGHLMIDGGETHAAGGAATVWVLERALAGTRDAALRAMAAWFEALWTAGGTLGIDDRTVLHVALLNLTCSLAGRPVNVGLDLDERLGSGAAMPPVLVADRLGRRILDLDGRGPQAWTGWQTGLEGRPAAEVLAVAYWLVRMPYVRFVGGGNSLRFRLEPSNVDPGVPAGDGIAAVHQLVPWIRRAGPSQTEAVIADLLAAASGSETEAPGSTSANTTIASESSLFRMLDEAVGDRVATPSRVALRVAALVLGELRFQGKPVRPWRAIQDDSLRRRRWLDRALAERLDRLAAGSPADRSLAADLLSTVDAVAKDSTDWLTEATGTDVLGAGASALSTLHRAAGQPPALSEVHALVDLVANGDAATSARAAQALVGSYRGVIQPTRRYRLSETGGDLWMAVVRESRTAAPPIRWMLHDVLYQWDIDDPDEVARLANTVGGDGTPDWQRALSASVTWQPDAQRALARWLASSPVRPGDVEAAMLLVGRLLAYPDNVPATDEVVDATIKGKRRVRTAMRSLDRFDESWLRVGVAQTIVECAATALRSAAAGSRPQHARVLFEERTVPVIRSPTRSEATAQLATFGNLIWASVAAPADAASRFVTDEIMTSDAATLLADWLAVVQDEIDVRPEHPQPGLLDVVHEALLSLLAVVTEHDATPLADAPGMQGLLVRAALTSQRAGAAAFTLLGRLPHLVVAANGEDALLAAIEAHLRYQQPAVVDAISACLRQIPYVYGTGLADVLITRMATTTNETVLVHLARVLRAHMEDPTCTGAELQRARQALRTFPGAPGHRFPVYATGIGTIDDPRDWLYDEQNVNSTLRRLLYSRNV
ncbi:caspase family protein [Phytohabitans flavus]|uniref:caspase, EACC1-associated type n=1 Tax=Phytohabitans flavus TaxID=1076124 RepID=UPI00363B7091